MRAGRASRRGAMAAVGGAVAVGLLVGLARPAWAHTADASVSQTCVNGTSQSTVQFNNNFDLPATLTYSGLASGSLALPPMGASTPGTNSVTLAVPAPTTLTYRVLWSDGFTQGNRSVPLQPIIDCLPPSTTAPTTAPEVGGVTTSPTTTTPLPPPKVEVLPTTVVAQLGTTTPVVAAPAAPDSQPTPSRAPAATPARLPATGADPTIVFVAGGALVAMGALLLVGRRWADRT